MKSILSSRKRWVTLLCAALLLCIAGLALQRFIFAQEPVSYITATAARMDLEEKVLASGILNARKTVDVGAQVSGQLKKLHVAAGDQVKKGDLLAEIDPVLPRNALRDAEATLENVRAQKSAKQALLRQYTLAFKRQGELLAEDATTRAELESAQAQLETTRADLAALEAQIAKATIAVDTARANLEYTRILAPMDGVVLTIATEEGQTVVSTQSATTIVTLADLDSITVKAKISEADVLRLRPGLATYFTLLGDAETRYAGRLRAIEPASTTASASGTSSGTSSSSNSAVYYHGIFEVPNPGHKLKVSMTAQVTIIVKGARSALCIPVSALEQRGADGRGSVKVLRNGLAETRAIRTGISDNVQVQVLEGLREGELVVIGDSASLPATATAEKQRPGPPPGRR